MKSAAISDIEGLQLEYTMPVESLLYESRQVGRAVPIALTCRRVR